MSRPARVPKTNMIAALIALLIAVPGGAYILTRPDEKPQQTQTQDVESAHTDEHQHEDAIVQAEYVSYKGEEGKTALDLLKSHTQAQTKTSDFGEFVVSINGNDGGGTKYWMFFVDGKESATGAGAHQSKPGETIEWKLQ